MTKFDEGLVLVEMEFGSHLYGLNTEKSDRDYIGVFMPTLDDILLGRGESILQLGNDSKVKNTKDDIDRTMYSFPAFIKGLVQGNTNVLDMIHAPESSIIVTSTFWTAIIAYRDLAYTKSMNSLVGYCRTQASKYGRKGDRLAAAENALAIVNGYPDETILGSIFDKLPVESEHANIITTNHPSTGEQHFYEICNRKFQDTVNVAYTKERLLKMINSYGHRAQLAKDNDGMDWKAISHAFRAGYQARAIFKEGGFEYPLKETPFIMQVKNGELDFESEVAPKLDDLVSEVELLSEHSTYPTAVDEVFWDNFMLDVYHGMLVDTFGKSE